MNAERLLKLADALEKPMPSGFRFHFAYYHREAHCGTLGCAIGLCPFVFPEEWERREDGFPYLIGEDYVWNSGIKFFELSERDYSRLFEPTESPFEGWLDRDASATEVAANIRAFVASKTKVPA